MNKLELTYLKALECTTTGEVDHAKGMVEDLLEINPEFGKAHYLLGWIYYENLNNLVKAAKHAKEAIRQNPEYPMGYYLYCDILLESKQTEELKTVIEGAVKMKSVDKAFLFHKLACAYEQVEQYQNAIGYLRQALLPESSNSWESFINKEIVRVRRKMGLVRKISTIVA